MGDHFLLIFVLISLFAMATPAMGATYLYANVPGGTLGGGLGFDLGGGQAIDLCASAINNGTGSAGSLYLDYFMGNWGIAVTSKQFAVENNSEFDMGLQYALEQNISDKATIGISVNLIDYDVVPETGSNWIICGAFCPYIKLEF